MSVTTRIGGVYRLEVTFTLERASQNQIETAREIAEVLSRHMPDVLETKCDILYEEITLFKGKKLSRFTSGKRTVE